MGVAGRIAARLDALPGGPVGVAVSGGSDSTALLMSAVEWARERGRKLRAATVDHGLRRESVAEADAVAQQCARLDVPHRTLRWDGSSASGNIQSAAREARYRLLAEWAHAHQLDCVLIGHTRDDVAETFLMRLARGSGIDGLSAMAPEVMRHGILFCRPMLDLSREELRKDLERREIPWTDDPSNSDDRFDRVRVRKAFAQLAPLGITPDALVHTAMRLADAREVVDAAACAAMRDRITWDRAGEVTLATRGWRGLPHEIRVRLLKGAIALLTPQAYPPRQEAIDGIDDEIGARVPFTRTISGTLIRGTDENVSLFREPAAVAAPQPLETGQTVWDERWDVVGPASQTLMIGALGEDGLRELDWRASGFRREALLTTPALHQPDTLPRSLLLAPPEGYSVVLRYSVPPRTTR
ncbi:MAG: tRNA lysidine(34) synthetase TilS [Pseudomonadota bacterium]